MHSSGALFLSGGKPIYKNVKMRQKTKVRYLLPLQRLLCAIITRFFKYTMIITSQIMKLTAVSSIVLSTGSTLPPGKEVSPAYVLSEADRLSKNYIPPSVHIQA